MNELETPPPILLNDQSGVGIHLAYIIRDLTDIKKIQKENWESISNELKELKGVYISRGEYTGHLEDYTLFKRNSVTQEEFKPVKSIVYGIVAMILIAVFGAIIGVVIIKAK